MADKKSRCVFSEKNIVVTRMYLFLQHLGRSRVVLRALHALKFLKTKHYSPFVEVNLLREINYLNPSYLGAFLFETPPYQLRATPSITPSAGAC